MNQDLDYDFEQVVLSVQESGLCRSLVTFQEPSGTYGPSGAPSNTFTTIAGLIDIECMAAPSTLFGRVGASEDKTLPEILAKRPQHVWLAGYYPTTEEGFAKGWQAVIDGVVFDLLGAESDSQHQTTRIEVRRAGI